MSAATFFKLGSSQSGTGSFDLEPLLAVLVMSPSANFCSSSNKLLGFVCEFSNL
jgi:hypothetical protein